MFGADYEDIDFGMNPSKTKIVIVDDDDNILLGLKVYIESEHKKCTAETYNNAGDFLCMLSGLKRSDANDIEAIVLDLDVKNTEVNGLHLARDIKSKFGDLFAVIIYTGNKHQVNFISKDIECFIAPDAIFGKDERKQLVNFIVQRGRDVEKFS